ncbi:MAG: hypothetical protein LWX11_08830 [Firmicutes bacterium]|nr:hypothetical protein [Bacillota bacterium]
MALRRQWLKGGLAALWLGAGALHAQQLSLLGGALLSPQEGKTTYAWQAMYSHQIAPDLGLSLGWLNEGHLSEHHRDGLVLQGWARLAERGAFSYLAGVGLYRSYDTQPFGDAHLNQHGVRGLFSLGLHYRPMASRWRGQLTFNRIGLLNDGRNLSVLAGVGLILSETPLDSGQSMTSISLNSLPQHEVGIHLGRSILNSYSSEASEGYAVDYHYRVGRHWSLAATYANEGAPGQLERDGLSIQAELGASFLSNRLMLGFALGPHVGKARTQGEEGSSHLRLGLQSSIRAGWRLNTSYVVRGTWYRTSTRYDRDTDLLTAGLGYTW